MDQPGTTGWQDQPGTPGWQDLQDTPGMQARQGNYSSNTLRVYEIKKNKYGFLLIIIFLSRGIRCNNIDFI